MSMTEPDKNFFKAISISATVHIAGAALVLISLAPVPAVLLPDSDRNIISVSLVDFSIGGRKPKNSGGNRAAVLKVGRSGQIRQSEKENIAEEEAKNDLTEKKTQPSDAALTVYTNERSHSGETRGRGVMITGQNYGGINNYAKVNGPTEGLRTPLLIPAYRQNNPPRYPMTARLRGQEGMVLVAANILADGKVGNVKVKKSSGYKDLDNSAVEAVRKWLFQPGQHMGVAISMWVDVPIRFSLRD